MCCTIYPVSVANGIKLVQNPRTFKSSWPSLSSTSRFIESLWLLAEKENIMYRMAACSKTAPVCQRHGAKRWGCENNYYNPSPHSSPSPTLNHESNSTVAKFGAIDVKILVVDVFYEYHLHLRSYLINSLQTVIFFFYSHTVISTCDTDSCLCHNSSSK